MRAVRRLSCLLLALPLALTMCAAPAQPSALPPAGAASPAVSPAATVTFYSPAGNRNVWKRVPTIGISSAPDDARRPLVQRAVDFWNQQFQSIGTPFRLGPVVDSSVQFADADLKAIGNPDAPGQLSPAAAKQLAQAPGDVVIALSGASFVSVTHRQGDKVLIAIQGRPGGTDDPVLNMNVIAHELGHAVGLGHNSDPALMMCGRPATCRPGVDQFIGLQGFAPLADAEKALLLQLYPADWQAAP